MKTKLVLEETVANVILDLAAAAESLRCGKNVGFGDLPRAQQLRPSRVQTLGRNRVMPSHPEGDCRAHDDGGAGSESAEVGSLLSQLARRLAAQARLRPPCQLRADCGRGSCLYVSSAAAECREEFLNVKKSYTVEPNCTVDDRRGKVCSIDDLDRLLSNSAEGGGGYKVYFGNAWGCGSNSCTYIEFNSTLSCAHLLWVLAHNSRACEWQGSTACTICSAVDRT